jgi:dihydropyrimidinase
MILVRGGTVVTSRWSGRADVLVDGETIRAVGLDLAAGGSRVIDATGRLVFAGGVDPHVHMALPIGGGLRSSDDFSTGTRAALSGGTTTIIDFVTPVPGEALERAVEHRLVEAAGSLCDYALHVSVVSWGDRTADEMKACVDAGYSSFKVYLAYKERGLGLADGDLLGVLEAASALDAVVLGHCENGDAVSHLQRRLVGRGDRAPRFHALSRPPEVEVEAVGRAIALAGIAGCRLYVVHVSTAGAAQAIARARAAGQEVHGEVCPHHLVLDSGCYERPEREAAAFVMSPPLRPASEPPQLWNALARGTLETVATDHCPFLRRDRERDLADFTRIPNGVGGVEHRLALLWTFGVGAGRFDASRFVALACEAPARIMGLYPRKGALEPGSDADIVVWDPDRERTITAATQVQRCDTCVYEGLRVRGRAETVLLRGRVVVSRGEVERDLAPGRLLRRGPGQSRPAPQATL